MLYAWLIIGTAVCAIQAIRATRLLSAALWLAGVSALVAITLFKMGAEQVAVIELSVGAGLVTVLFVFAISIAGDDAMEASTFIPNRFAIGLMIAFAALLGWMILPLEEMGVSVVEFSFAGILWDQRGLDVLVQVILIFTGVMCVLGLLTESAPPASAPENQVEEPALEEVGG